MGLVGVPDPQQHSSAAPSLLPAAANACVLDAETLETLGAEASVGAARCAEHRTMPRALPWERAIELVRARTVLSKALLSIVDQVIVSGTSFATAIILVRSCTPEEAGVYYLLLSILSVLIGVQQSAIAAPYTILYNRVQGQRRDEYTGSTWIHQWVLTAVAMLGLLAAIGALSFTAGHPIAPALWVLLGVAPLMLFREATRRFAFARLAVWTAICLDAVICALQLGGLVLLGWLGQFTVPLAFGVMATACGTTSAACWAWGAETPRFARPRIWQDWIHNWTLGKWGLCSYLTVDTIPYLMPWFVSIAAGPAETGVLGACTTLVGIVNVFVIGTGNFLRPQAAATFTSQGIGALSRLLFYVAALFAVGFGAFCALIFLTGDQLAVLVYGDRLQGSGFLLLALAASVPLGSVGLVAGCGLWAVGRPRAGLPADLCMVCTTILAAFWLTSSYGALGAALAVLGGTLVGAGLKVAALCWVMKSLQRENDRGQHDPLFQS